MKNPLVLTGEVYVPGAPEQLLQAISRVQGTLTGEGQFRSSISRMRFGSGPVTFFNIRGICIRFLCSYVQKGSGYLVTYRAHLPVLFYLAAAALVYLMVAEAFFDLQPEIDLLTAAGILIILTAIMSFTRWIFARRFEMLLSGEEAQ